jgi:hypothetical protein
MIEQPIIAGAGGKGGGSGGGLNESPDTLKSTSYAQVLDLISEGEIGGLVNGLKSIYLDDTPIQNADGTNNFAGVTYVANNGTQAQAVIAGFDQVTNEVAVATEVKASTGPVVRSITLPEVTSLAVTVQIPALSYMDSSGNLGGSTVAYAIEIQIDGGGWITKINETLTGKCTSVYERQYRINLPAGTTRDIRLRRITADASSSTLNNKTYFKSYTEIIDAKLSYPNSALVGVKVDASQFNSIPKRGYDTKLLKIKFPTNATVRADGSLLYSGVWNGTFQIGWCSCPAWCFYDLLTTARYGLGSFIDSTKVDKWSLYTISKYCNTLISNGFGGTEPRFSCNMWLNTRTEAYTAITQMSSIFRGMTYWNSGAISSVQDAPSDPAYLFTNANVIEGMFTYQGSSAKARHTVALVTWNDPADMYRQKVEYVEDTAGIARYGVISTSVLAVACSSRGQAHRVGRWLLYSERYETDVVAFSTGTEGVLCKPGDVIKVADQYRAGTRIGGRISSATSGTITVDSLTGVSVTGGTLYVVNPDGTVQTRSITSAAGNVVAITPAFSPTPMAQSQWVIATPTLDAQTYRVLSVTENDNGEHSITALAHDETKYAAIENNLTLQTRNITSLSPVPSDVASVSMSESLYRYQNDVRAKITVSWPSAANATAYRVEWRSNNGNYLSEITSAIDYDILNTTVAKYDVKVTAIGVFGTPSQNSTAASINALGKTAPPSDVTGFTSTTDSLIGVTLSWTSVPDLDLAQYEIRQGASWAAGTLVTRINATTYKIGLISGTSQTYWIKAVDTTNNYSVNATSLTTTISVPSTPTVTVQVVDNNVLLKWTAVTSTLAVDHYEIRRGSTWAGGAVVGSVANATFAALFETSSGSYTYWVAGVDLGGNYGVAGSVVATVNQPPDYQLFLNYASTFSGTLSNAVVASGVMYLAVNTTETVTTHFTARSWSTPQDQINAGYPYFIEPTGTTAFYEEVVDYGASLPAAKVSLVGNYSTAFGSATVTPKISVSNTSSTGPWTDYPGLAEVYASAFRYIKVRYDVTAAAGDDLVAFTSINVTLDVKQRSDFGTVAAVSTDTGGTVVTFGTAFVDVASITLTPLGTTRLTAVYDFVDVPYPTTFKVLLFDSSGARASGNVSWAARGY